MGQQKSPAADHVAEIAVSRLSKATPQLINIDHETR
jgi:hypothetical protein